MEINELATASHENANNWHLVLNMKAQPLKNVCTTFFLGKYFSALCVTYLLIWKYCVLLDVSLKSDTDLDKACFVYFHK